MNRQTDYYPPPGRPGWSGPKAEQLELLYLAWGWRKYRETPQGITTRDGWLYFTTRRGTPHLLVGPRKVAVQAGELVILHPDCACGFDDEAGSVTEICTWVWRSPSRWSSLHPAAGSFAKLSLSPDHAQKIRILHDQTRREIQTSDENTRIALDLLRQQLDLTLVRSQSDRPQPATDHQRLELACRWIDQHLHDHNSVAGLCDYLQLSPSTLNRIFQRCLLVNVRAYAKQARLRRAQHLIMKDGMSVKEAAYTLGYRFPNDLSRAFAGERAAKAQALNAKED
jgi:AraC-like DNA-binding protein